MNFEYLCRVYSLGTLHSIIPLSPGTEAEVWRLDTECGSFLVRTLPSKEKGELEWAVFSHLKKRGFRHTPAILAPGNVPFVEAEGCLYQVQEYLFGSMPDPALPGIAEKTGRLLRKLADALSDFPGGPVIHGDLGPWNMLLCDDGLYVIDFGSARSGDPHFDFAAALGGIINHTPADLRKQVCRKFLAPLNADRDRLLSALRDWAAEGVARWSGQNQRMTARFHHALTWAEENLYEL